MRMSSRRLEGVVVVFIVVVVVVFQTYWYYLCPGSLAYDTFSQCFEYFRILQTRDLANEYSFQEDDGSLPPDMRWARMKMGKGRLHSQRSSVCPNNNEGLWQSQFVIHNLFSQAGEKPSGLCWIRLAQLHRPLLHKVGHGHQCAENQYLILIVTCLVTYFLNIWHFFLFRIPMWVMHFGSYKF